MVLSARAFASRAARTLLGVSTTAAVAASMQARTRESVIIGAVPVCRPIVGAGPPGLP